LSFILGHTKCGGNTLDQKRSRDTPLIKLAYETDSNYKLKHKDQSSYDYEFFTQEAWGRRHIDDNGNNNGHNNNIMPDGKNAYTSSTSTYASDANILSYAISTENSKINVNTTYHYVVCYVNGLIDSYVTDDDGNIIIEYQPIDTSSVYNGSGTTNAFVRTPADITGIYLGNSNGYYLNNIAYKSINIYKGADAVTVDSEKDHYLYAYFRGDSDDGEKLRYAVSSDGVNFTPLNYSLPVWNPDSFDTSDITVYPQNANAEGNYAVTKHIRDPYVFAKQDGSGYYILATDLESDVDNGEENGDYGADWTDKISGHPVVNNCKILVWDLKNLKDISSTTPWTIDTQKLPGMLDIIGTDAGQHIRKAYAPQAIWDPNKNAYMLYWGCAWMNNSNEGSDTCVYYSYTTDFQTFTTPKKLLSSSPCTSDMDADITYYKGLYYLWFKNEAGGTTALRYYYATSPNPNGPYSNFTFFDPSRGNIEGPQVYQKADGTFMLMSPTNTAIILSLFTAQLLRMDSALQTVRILMYRTSILATAALFRLRLMNIMP
jgi:hypothetical protein